MYTDYFKLSEPPFSLTPDPRYLFMSERHREGLAHLLYGVQQDGGFVQLTGDIGSGKTTLCRCLVKQLPPETDVAVILNPRLTVIELLATVCDELGVSYPAGTDSVKVLIDALNQRLLESHARGRRTVLIIDEAQNLHADVLEQIRLLTNLETSKEKLLQIILIGQPELLSVLKDQKLRQLAQRITARYHLLALSKRETYAYIQHRLLVSGARDPLFTARAMRLVYTLSGGVPRVINIICDRALLGAYAIDKRRISASIVRKASRETRGNIAWRRRFHLVWMSGILGLAALILGAAVLLEPAVRSALRHGAQSLIDRGARPSRDKATQSASMPQERSSRIGIPSPGAGSAGNNEAVSSAKSGQATKTQNADAIDPDPEGISLPASKGGMPLRLVEVLANATLAGQNNSSFARLYNQWGDQPSLDPTEPGCKAARSRGFECLSLVGNWLKLRRYDIPAILEILLPTGARRQVTVIGLTDEAAMLAIGNREYTFQLSEINQVWDGSFILLWKPPFTVHQLSIGDAGKDVVWIRSALDIFEGKKPGASPSELFDEDLKRRIIAFQRNQSLIQDGFVGSETLVRLSVAMLGPKAPSLSRRTR